VDIASLGTVKVLPIDDVRPAPDNPRKIGAAAVDVVAKSLAEFGWQQPLVVDTQHVVIAGHTRLLAAKKLGLSKVPVVVADNLTPKQVKAFRIADNRSADFTSWDFTALTQQLDELAADFSDVLALADWEAIVTDYEALVAPATDGLVPEAPALEQHGEEDDLAPSGSPVSGPTNAARPHYFVDDDEDGDEDEDDEFDRIDAEQNPAPVEDKVTNYLSKEYQLTVICESETAARHAAATIIDLPGVTDVRNKR
jgi:hypothetical protein